MPQTQYTFGEWTPDAANTGTTTVATNVLAIANGYAPVKGFSAITEALPADFFGGGAFVGSDGTSSLLAGTATDLYLFSGTWGSVLNDVASARWRPTQFGDNAIFSNGGKLISFDLLAQTAGEIAASPSNCIDVARVRDFVVALRDDDTVEWSEFNNSQNWGTGENQADEQPLLGGGKGVAIVGGENGLVLQKNSVQRMSYTGGDVIFQFDVISDELGCITQGSVASTGMAVFWLSERGFMMSPDRQSVVPIGDEKFNRWFFANYSRSQIDDMYAATDPRRSLVLWSMPGTPGRIIAYNWVLQRATVIETNLSGIFTGFTNNVSIDALDAIYPEGLDSIPVSLDDPAFQGGSPLLLVANSDFEVGALEGDNLEASLQIDNIEPTSGRRSRIRSLRLVTDATSATLTVNARMRAGDSESIETAGSIRTNGKCHLRCNGRYNSIKAVIPAEHGWSYVQAVECEFEAGDGR